MVLMMCKENIKDSGLARGRSKSSVGYISR